MSFDRFLLFVESRDLSQADEYCKSVFYFNFTKLQFLNDKTYSYTKNNYLALGNSVFWSISSFKRKSKHLPQFFWLEVNLRGLRDSFFRKFRPQLLKDRKKKFCYPSFNFGKGDTIIRIVSLR